MTMIETAKANGLDPMTYIGSLLDELAQFPEWRKSLDLGDYLPWNYPKLMAIRDKAWRNEQKQGMIPGDIWLSLEITPYFFGQYVIWKCAYSDPTLHSN